MKLVLLLLTGLAICGFTACERQPASKIESMTADHAEKSASETGHTAEKAPEHPR